MMHSHDRLNMMSHIPDLIVASDALCNQKGG